MSSKARAERRREEKAAANGYLRVQNGDIFAAKEPLQKLLTKEWPVRTSFALARLANTLNGHLQDIESVRTQLIRKYGKPTGDQRGTTQVNAESEEYPKFLEELNDLFGLEVEVAVQKIAIPADSLNGMTVEAGLLLPLLQFIELQEPKEG